MGIARAGTMTRLSSGTAQMLKPKPVKPRSRPAKAMLAAKAAQTDGVTRPAVRR